LRSQRRGFHNDHPEGVPFKGRGLGVALLADALRRCAAASSAIAGVRGVLVHAIDDEAAGFYQRFGFTNAPQFGERTLLTWWRSCRDQVSPVQQARI